MSWHAKRNRSYVSSVDLPSDSLCKNLAWWAVTRRTSKNHKTVKMGGWALAWVWALARDITVLTSVTGRLRDAQTIKVHGVYSTSKVDLILHETPPGAKRPPLCMASAFCGKHTSITMVDLIQRKKLDPQNFYESNLTEARFLVLCQIVASGSHIVALIEAEGGGARHSNVHDKSRQCSHAKSLYT